jgi:hypothetical protein
MSSIKNSNKIKINNFENKLANQIKKTKLPANLTY